MTEERQQTEWDDDGRSALRRARWAMRAWFAAVVVALCCLAAWPVVRRHLQATAVLRLVSDKPVPWLLRMLAMEPVRAELVQFDTPDGVVHARLYLPVRHPDAPGLVVLHGVHYLGMNEPRLMSFAASMAACGLRVLTPELPGIKDYHVDTGSMRVIGDSAVWFSRQTGAPVGVMGLSFSGGLALVAASEPEYGKHFKFVFAVGPHDDMVRVEHFYLTGTEQLPDGSVEHLKPNDYGALVIEYEHLDDFVAAKDEAAIRPVLREHLYENPQAENAALTRLTTAQHAEAMQLMDTDLPATKAELAADEQKHLEAMAAVSPHGKLAALTTPVYLLHGEADNVVPSGETLWLARELPKQALKAMLISPVVSHVETQKAGIRDRWQLVNFFARVLEAAEKK